MISETPRSIELENYEIFNKLTNKEPLILLQIFQCNHDETERENILDKRQFQLKNGLILFMEDILSNDEFSFDKLIKEKMNSTTRQGIPQHIPYRYCFMFQFQSINRTSTSTSSSTESELLQYS